MMIRIIQPSAIIALSRPHVLSPRHIDAVKIANDLLLLLINLRRRVLVIKLAHFLIQLFAAINANLLVMVQHHIIRQRELRGAGVIGQRVSSQTNWLLAHVLNLNHTLQQIQTAKLQTSAFRVARSRILIKLRVVLFFIFHLFLIHLLLFFHLVLTLLHRTAIRLQHLFNLFLCALGRSRNPRSFHLECRAVVAVRRRVGRIHAIFSVVAVLGKRRRSHWRAVYHRIVSLAFTRVSGAFISTVRR
mmetsp:Transcript_41010/g.65949  ORF Transcript_41010/g.65949 Transcript_41010/m.65949 type:complete len:245 (-) Transcript_41010:25-759(-)